MKILIDDARPRRVERALAVFPLLGVTTNPTILRAAEPSDFASDLARLRGLVGERDLHVQVVARDTGGMLRDARPDRKSVV